MSSVKRARGNWRQRYDATRRKIARLRKAVDLDAVPQYRVEVRETARTIEIARETYTLVFDKRRAMVTRAVIEGTRLDEVCCPHLLVVNEQGRELKQSDSTDGDLRVRHEKFSVFLDGHFTLDGRRVPVVYEMDRMTGTTFCTMDVPGPLKVRRLTLEHSLGPTPRPLDTFYAPHHYLRRFHPYEPVVINEHKIDLIFEKDTMMFWTNGVIGLQVFSISWDESRVLDDETKFRYGTGEIRGGASWVDLTFFSTGTTDAIDLPDGYCATCAFSPMPFKKWRPLGEIFGSTYLNPPPVTPGYDKGEEIEAVLNHFGRCGVTLVCAGESHGCNDPADPAITKWFAETARRNGVRVVLYIERSLADLARHPKVGMLTADEIREGRQELVSHFGPINNGAPQWGVSGPMCCNYEPWRTHILTMIDYHLDEMDFDGVYLDSSFICSCHNVRHGESPGESTSVRGSMIFQQDLRLLLDDYARRRKKPYTLINHYWDQHAAPVAGVSDFTMPGEQDAYKRHKRMTPENVIYGYSAIPNGVNFIWYSSDSYDYTSPQIYNDAADCGALIWLCPHRENLNGYPPEGLCKHAQHVQPLVQFGLDGARPVHRFSAEYSKLFAGGDEQTRATLYLKDDTFLVYLVNDGPSSTSTSFSVAVPKEWKRCLVLNAADMRWHVVEPARRRLAMDGLDCSRGPLPLVVRPYPRTVGLNWHDNQCRHVEVAVRGRTIRVKARGVARSCGALYFEVPKGTALERLGRIMGRVSDEIYAVPVVFNAEGKAQQTLKIVPAPEVKDVWQWPPLES